jgi:hypothetical protein
MAGKIFGDTAKGLGNLAADAARKAVGEPGKIFESATGGSSSSDPALPKQVSPAESVGTGNIQRPVPVVDREKEQAEIDRLSQQLKSGASSESFPVKRDVEAEITEVRQKKDAEEKQSEEEEFLRKLQEERQRERLEAQKDAEDIIPKSKPSQGSAPSQKAAGTKEMGKKRTG